MKRLLPLFCCLAAACTQAQQPQPDLLTQLRSLDKSCSSDAQCRTVPLGAKPCGGPEAYLAYSTANNQHAKVAEMASRYSQQRTAENQQRSGMAGDCMMLPDPGAVCRAGACQLGGGASDK